MKKLLLMVATALATAILSFGEPVYSQNAVGYTKVTIPGYASQGRSRFVLASINYEKSDGNSKTLSELFGDGTVRQSDAQALADNLYIWNGIEYLGYFKKADGSWYQFQGTADPDPQLTPGQGLFIGGPAYLDNTNNDIYIHGQVNLDDTTDITMSRGFNMIGNPYPVDLDFGDTDWSVVPNATAGLAEAISDRVFTYNPDTQTYTTYILQDGFVWYNKDLGILENPVIGPGEGCWYEANNFTPSPPGGANKGDIIWSISRGFTYP